jgi:hypothetical protein
MILICRIRIRAESPGSRRSKIDEAGLVNKGINEYEQGKVVDGRSSIQKLRKQHGI